MTITAQHLETVLRSIPGAYGRQAASLAVLAAGANDALRTAPGTLTVKAAAAFLATMCQESGSLRYLEEIKKNGPYAPFIGRTFEQLTWKSNYLGFGQWCKNMGLISDENVFVNSPKSLADPKWAWLGGVWFWRKNSIWSYADNFLKTQRAVNIGNPNTTATPKGMSVRNAWYNAWLKIGDALLPATTTPTWDGKSFPGVNAFYIGAHADYITLLGERLEIHGWTGYSAGPGPTFSETDKVAVKWFQEKQGWTGTSADGVPGEKTWALLLSDPLIVILPEPPVKEPIPDPVPETPVPPIVPTKIVEVIAGGSITSPFGYKANNPATGKSYWAAGYHPGDDWNKAPQDLGLPALSAVTGKVVHAGTGGWGSAYGKHVIVESQPGHRTAHCHFSKVSVSVGQIVVAGDELGKVGDTGNVTGPHCHVERRRSPFGYGKYFEKPIYQKIPARSYPTPKSAVVYTSLLTEGRIDSDSVFWIQLALGVPLTGDYDDATKVAAMIEQKRQGSVAEFCDGYLGLTQTNALMKNVNLPVVIKEKP